MMINSIDVTLICLNIIGAVLLIGYSWFAYMVTHRGDFYHIRRWKAALLVAAIPGIIVFVIPPFSPISIIISHSSGKNLFELVGLIINTIFPTLVIIIPLLIVITIGTRRQLKWWLNSDDFLDMVWKDPNKGHKSPIQEL
jgi:hypothetical protein